jgi:hypothetical protein
MKEMEEMEEMEIEPAFSPFYTTLTILSYPI